MMDEDLVSGIFQLVLQRTKVIPRLVLTFFDIWVCLNKHSELTGQQGKGEGISKPLQIAAAVLKPGPFGFRAQVANH